MRHLFCRCAAICATLLTLSVGASVSVHAQTSDPELADLRRRLEALERQNEQLRQSMLQPLPSPDDVMPADDQYLTGILAERANLAPDGNPAAGHEVGSDLKMTASWKDGLELSTANKDFRVHIGGRTQFDVGWFSVDQNVNQNINIPYGDGMDFRRARL